MIQTPFKLLPTTGTLVGPAWNCDYPKIEGGHTDGDVVYVGRDGRAWFVPSGMPTDGASYPWPVRCWLSPFDKRVIRSAIVHDFRYQMHDYFRPWPDTREAADRDFLDGLQIDNAPIARVQYAAVRLCGNAVYRARPRSFAFVEWARNQERGSRMFI